MLKRTLRLVVCAGMLLYVQACATDDARSDEGSELPIELSDRSMLTLRAVEKNEQEVIAEVSYVRGIDSPGPRVLELRLKLGDALKLVEASPGAALTHADKELVAQQRESGLLRLVAYSSGNVAPLDSGVIARLRLARADAGSTRVELLTDAPLFAPREAQEGLIVGDAIDL